VSKVSEPTSRKSRGIRRTVASDLRQASADQRVEAQTTAKLEKCCQGTREIARPALDPAISCTFRIAIDVRASRAGPEVGTNSRCAFVSPAARQAISSKTRKMPVNAACWLVTVINRGVGNDAD